MNAITMIQSGTLTMSSREIAILVESRHDDVKRSIERLSERGVITLPPLAEVPNDGPGPRFVKEYHLRKRDSLVVVAQLCPEFTAKIIDRWQELEERAAKPTTLVPQSLPEALRLAADMAEQKAKAEAQLALVAPKAHALDRLATASQGSFCIRDAAKNLQVQEKWLRSFLIQQRWIYRRPMGSELLAYSDKIQAGLMEHKITTGEKSDGTEWTNTQARITAKGMAKIAQSLAPIIGS
ncbi:phage antirepressor KilAC domain-containing protein [Limnobacter sp. P1]|uniref:phage antirepressor KilAC domain-containing protein n=1 Tax=Limnobacter olei TaxID=3031298 RepID=UPI0023B1BD77|nr:phage antirepressor KilAC domain-containing protein [Limnobacter sp. P1]